MLARITHVQHLGGHRLQITFTTGEVGIVDYSEEAKTFKGVLTPLADSAYFGQVIVDAESGTLVWPGEIDFDPDVIYSKATGAPLAALAAVSEE